MKVNVGIVGCGYWGPKHIRNFSELPDANLKVVCDLDERKLDQVRAQYPGVRTTTDPDDLIRDVDAVVIATPVSTHYTLAKKALLGNKHVLVEKPLTATSREALDLATLSENRKLVLMAGHTYEYHPAVNYLREAIQSGELGEIYTIDSHRLNLGLFRPDVNVLWDLAPHDICIMLSLLNEDPIAVSARGARHGEAGLYNDAHLEIVFPSGTMGHIHVSWLHPRKIRQTTIVGSKKMVVYDDVSESEKLYVYDKGLILPDDGFSSWPPSYRHGDVLVPYISGAEPLRLECNHFLHCVKDGKRPRSDGWSGFRVTSILEAAERSLLDGGLREKLQPTETIARNGTAIVG
jgi:predicted dehydrogenase